ncbi:MAG TPA: DUF58 domain-containing protein [Chthoniobacteraceae bacterium]|nr:DUF58 domain-containing protein [Chthoniobacteraceae bacterium]
MLVPRTRLILWVSLIVLPFAAVGATLPGAWAVSAVFIGGLFVLVLFDAASAPRALAGISVALPQLVRLQKDRAGSIEVRIQNDTMAARALRLGLALPREIASPADDLVTSLPAGAALSRVEWPVTPARRGQYRIERTYLEAASPLGFWSIRSSQPADAELRVYPDLHSERKNVAALFLRRSQLGMRAQRQAGQGRDFEKLREYVPGDSLDEIHWKASAKRGHLVTKVFQVERTQEVYVIIDASRLSGRKVSAPRVADASEAPPASSIQHPASTAIERFVTAALILGAAAERQGDQFGLLTFSDRVLSFVRAKNGPAHYDACRDRLYALQPQLVAPDFDELCSFIRMRLRKRALLIFLTALDDPMLAESFVKSAALICRQHFMLVDMLQPSGAAPIFGDADVHSVPELYQRLGGHLRWRDLRELQKVLQRRGIRLSLLDPEKLAAQLIEQHAEVKARQLI